MNNVPTHLKHKPIIAIDYEKYDKQICTGDAKCLSVGIASWSETNGEDKDICYSAKVFRKLDSGRWSPQSEELPLWRVIDLAALVIAVINEIPNKKEFEMNKEILFADKYKDILSYIEENKTFYQKKISNLKNILNYNAKP